MNIRNIVMLVAVGALMAGAGVYFAMRPSSEGASVPPSPPPVAEVAEAPLVAEPAPVAEPVVAAKGIEQVVEVAERPAVIEGPRPYKRVHVLAVGVDIALPQVGGQLRYAAADAKKVAEVLRERFGFSSIHVLTGEVATKDAILARLDAIQAEMDAAGGDDFIFFFSGHGFTKPGPVVGEGGSAARIGFLVPHDTSLAGGLPLEEWRRRGLEMRALTERVTRLPARHRLLLIDSCFSGLAFTEQTMPPKPAMEAYPQVIAHPTVQIMTAGLDTQIAMEDDGLGHGIFTYALLRQIGDADQGIRTVDEIFLPLRGTVRDQIALKYPDREMTPQHRYLRGTQGTFVFVPSVWLGKWAEARPSEAALQAGGAKGYYEPVSTSELTEIARMGAEKAQPKDPVAWQARIDRYETRASMGDPYAMTALAQIYGAGVGAPQNKKKASLWGKEGADVFSVSDFFKIQDPQLRALVDNVQKAYALYNEVDNLLSPGGDGSGGGKIDQVKAGFKVLNMLKGFAGGGAETNPWTALEKLRLEVLEDLKKPARNKIAADKVLAMAEAFNRLQGELSGEGQKEFAELAAALNRAHDSMELGMQKRTADALANVGKMLARLNSLYPPPAKT